MKRDSSNLILNYVRMHAGTFITTCLVGFIASFFNVLLPLSVGKFFELLYQEQSTKGKLLEMLSLPINDMQSFFIFFFSLIALRGVFGFFQNYLTAYTGERFIADLRVELFKAQLTMNLRHFEKRHLSRHLQKYTGDMRFIQKWMTKGVIGGPIDIFFLLFAFVALYQINAEVTLGLIASMFSAGIIMMVISRIIGKSTERRNNERGRLLEFVAQRLQGILSVKFFNREIVEVDRFKKNNDDFVATGKKTFVRQAFLESMLPIMFFLIIVVVMWLSVKFNGSNSPSNSLTFMLVLLYLQGAFRRILRLPAIWSQAKVSFDSLDRQLLKSRERRANKEALNDTYGLIKFNGVTLESGNQILVSNFSTLVHPNTVVFFQIENPEVRNSLLRVLGGTEKPAEGEIKIDNDSLADFNPFQIRKSLAYVSESLPLIGSTVFEAVSFYTTDEKRDKANKILTSLRFQEHYSGDRLAILLEGDQPKLNAGDALKLSFARAILTSKKTIILDNPFDGIDEATIISICEVLNKLKQKRTIIMMAPSCPGVLHFDKKVVV